MEQAYAQALWQTIESGTEPKKALQGLIESLKAHRREALLPRIARAFERFAAREMRKNALVLTIAREKDEHAATHAIREVLKGLDAAPHDLVVRIDDSLIGGWRLEGKGMLVDLSFKKQLLEMYNHATK